MKLGITASIGGFQSLRFDSNEKTTPQEAARDLIAQMEPLVQYYPSLRGHIQNIRTVYGL